MMRSVRLLVLIMALFLKQNGYGQPDSVRRFVDSALNLMQVHSMNSAKVKWNEIRSTTFRLADTAKTYSQTAAALHYAFNQLGDKHGWLVIDDKEYRNAALQKEAVLNENMKAAAAKGPRIYAGRVESKYAYLSIPFFGAQDTVSMNRFAQQLQDSLCKYVTKKTKGIILDLRLNAGGNVFPMVVGIQNLFPSSVIDGHRISSIGEWNLKDGRISLTETFYAKLRSSCGDWSRLPVAVLTGPITGSAGEFLAIAFTGRKNTTLIGEPTAGYSTGNQGYLLPGMNNGIVIAESAAVGPDGKVYPDGIKPYQQVDGDDFFDHSNDPKIRAAVKWLKKNN